jgi:ABC-2 type transport system permease protein
VKSGVWMRLAAIAWRDALIQASYQLQLLSLSTGPFVAAFMAFYLSGLIDDPAELQQYRGNYFDYVVAGVGLTAFAAFGISAFNDQIGAEQSAGTLEVLLAGPSRLGVLLLGGTIVPFGLVLFQVGALFVVGIGVFGVGVSPGALLSATPVVALTAVTFCALGIASAALVLLVKRGDPISGPVYQATLLLSGALFPVELFPGWLQAICRVTPAYHGVRGVRDALLTDQGFAGTFEELAILGAFSVVLVPLSVWLFGRSIRRAKMLGVLGSY